ncbi:sugar ABC transporter substrate-binding protein [Rhizobium sp.]
MNKFMLPEWSRRQFLATAGAGLASAAMPSLAFAEGEGTPSKDFPVKRWNAKDGIVGAPCPLPKRVAYQNIAAGIEVLELVSDELKRAAETEGLEFITSNSNGDAAKTIQQMRAMVQRGVCGLLSANYNVQAQLAVHMDAMKKGVCSVQFNAGPVTSILSSIQYEGGRTQAEFVVDYIKKEMGGDASVLYISGDFQEDLQARGRAFKDIMKANGYENLITSYQTPAAAGNGSQRDGFMITNTVLQQHPNINVVVGFNDEVALGALAALKAKGKFASEPKLMVCGIDGSGQAIAEISSGKSPYKSTAAVHFPMVGYLPGRLFGRWSRGETVPQYQVFNYALISDADHAARFSADYKDTPRIFDQMVEGDNTYITPLGSINYESRMSYYDGTMPAALPPLQL